MNKYVPKNFKEISNLYDEVIEKIPTLVATTQSQALDILNYLYSCQDISGVIEECIRKHPTFVPNVLKVREYLDKLSSCYQVMHNVKWLAQQPDYIAAEENDSDTSNSGGFSPALYDNVSLGINLLTAADLEVKEVCKITAQLQYSQNQFYDKSAILNLSKKLAQQQEQIQAQAQAMLKAKQQSKGR